LPCGTKAHDNQQLEPEHSSLSQLAMCRPPQLVARPRPQSHTLVRSSVRRRPVRRLQRVQPISVRDVRYHFKKGHVRRN